MSCLLDLLRLHGIKGECCPSCLQEIDDWERDAAHAVVLPSGLEVLACCAHYKPLREKVSRLTYGEESEHDAAGS